MTTKGTRPFMFVKGRVPSEVRQLAQAIQAFA
jgi:hypothetical protein